jgi:hypothetical protein
MQIMSIMVRRFWYTQDTYVDMGEAGTHLPCS